MHWRFCWFSVNSDVLRFCKALNYAKKFRHHWSPFWDQGKYCAVNPFEQAWSSLRLISHSHDFAIMIIVWAFSAFLTRSCSFLSMYSKSQKCNKSSLGSTLKSFLAWNGFKMSRFFWHALFGMVILYCSFDQLLISRICN